MSKLFWKEFEKIVRQIGPELQRLSKTIEMLKLSEEAHEKIVRQILPKATDEQVDFIVCDYPQISLFYYPHWKDGLRELGLESIEEIDKVYDEAARMVISHPNPLGMAIEIEYNMLGRDEDEDLLYYYVRKYVRTHKHAIEMWEEKIASEKRMFEKTLKAWVGLFVSDKSVSEHYYQIISHTLSSYSVRERKPKRAIK